jgi:hypothetical protein
LCTDQPLFSSSLSNEPIAELPRSSITRTIWVNDQSALRQGMPDRTTTERCVEAYYLQRTRFESIAERNRRRRQLTEDGNVEISRRDSREGQVLTPGSIPMWR